MPASSPRSFLVHISRSGTEGDLSVRSTPPRLAFRAPVCSMAAQLRCRSPVAGAHLTKSHSVPSSVDYFSDDQAGGGGGRSSMSRNLVSSPYLRAYYSLEGRGSQPHGWLIYPSSPSGTPRRFPNHGGDQAPGRGSGDFSDKVERLKGFGHCGAVEGGTLEVRLMAPEDVPATVKLLTGSFADIVPTPRRDARFLEFWAERYLKQKMEQQPHAAVLVGIYRQGAADPQLAATAEISFDQLGPFPTPAPPRGAPYVSNITVNSSLRRKHIGRNLLKACEELVKEMCTSKELYLHCRAKDKGPLKMYLSADYGIVKTDSHLTWLKFQRRKHLMCKTIA